VTLLVSSIGEEGTPVETIAARVATLWSEGADILNGARIDLTAANPPRNA
jgi:hypothetical protein